MMKHFNVVQHYSVHTTTQYKSTYTRKTVSSALIQQTAAQDGHNDFSRVASATVCGLGSQSRVPFAFANGFRHFFSSSCKVAEQFDQNIPLNHVHMQGASLKDDIQIKYTTKTKCWHLLVGWMHYFFWYYKVELHYGPSIVLQEKNSRPEGSSTLQEKH